MPERIVNHSRSPAQRHCPRTAFFSSVQVCRVDVQEHLNRHAKDLRKTHFTIVCILPRTPIQTIRQLYLCPCHNGANYTPTSFLRQIAFGHLSERRKKHIRRRVPVILQEGRKIAAYCTKSWSRCPSAHPEIITRPVLWHNGSAGLRFNPYRPFRGRGSQTASQGRTRGSPLPSRRSPPAVRRTCTSAWARCSACSCRKRPSTRA